MPSHRFSLSETFNKSKKGKLKNIEKTQDHSDNYILYRKRFMMNFLLSLSLLLNGHYWISFSAITKELSIYFNKKESHINWFSNVFLLFPGFISLISVFLPNIIGLRWCLILGCLLHGSGTALRFSALFIIKEDLNLQFIICMLGSVILSFSQGILKPLTIKV
uniref:Solute carrier family 49 member A3 (Trinotate prediction) n=1 Tax=Henneguya salminicola TaxID=69463 RepID=A0A6G3MDV9_HENSL